MWIIALLGASSAFVESTLAQLYKKEEEKTPLSEGRPITWNAASGYDGWACFLLY